MKFNQVAGGWSLIPYIPLACSSSLPLASSGADAVLQMVAMILKQQVYHTYSLVSLFHFYSLRPDCWWWWCYYCCCCSFVKFTVTNPMPPWLVKDGSTLIHAPVEKISLQSGGGGLDGARWIMVLLLFCSCCCSSLEKKQKNLHELICPWSRNGVRSSCFVSYLVLLM